MKALHTIIAAAAVAVLAGNAMAQTTTDEARAQVGQTRAAAAEDQAFQVPVLELVAPGDYRAAARNEGRMARFVEFHRSLQAHLEGSRSTPIAVNSETSARAEAARQRNENAMGQHAAHLQSSPTAWMIHQEVVGDQGPLAQR